MPLNTHLMDSLVARYGAAMAEHVYWGMVGEAKGPFSESGKYHAEHQAWAKKAGVPALGTTRRRAKKSPRRR